MAVIRLIAIKLTHHIGTFTNTHTHTYTDTHTNDCTIQKRLWEHRVKLAHTNTEFILKY